MSRRTAAVLAWSVGGLTIALMAPTVILYAANRSDAVNLPYFLVPEATAALVGILIAARRPRNPVGWLILGHAVCFTVGEFTRQYALYGLVTEPGSLPLARVMASPPYWIWYPGIVLVFSLLPLYFPNGRLVSPRWRVVTRLAVVIGLLETLVAAVRPGDAETPGVPNPLGFESLQGGVLTDGVSLMWLPLGALSAASLVVRFRRSRGEERQQIKWVVYAVVLLASYALADQFVLQGRLSPVSDLLFFLVFFEGLWLAIAVAVLRYRLYDIDIVINRTLVYGALTLMLAALYLGGVAATQAVLHALTDQEQPQFAVVASTLAIAALFNPVRHRVQAFIDKRFYRSKYDARKTLEAFSAKLRDQTDLDKLGEDLVAVATETMHPAHVGLWLRPGARWEDEG